MICEKEDFLSVSNLHKLNQFLSHSFPKRLRIVTFFGRGPSFCFLLFTDPRGKQLIKSDQIA